MSNRVHISRQGSIDVTNIGGGTSGNNSNLHISSRPDLSDTNLTQELIFLLYLFYDKVYIYKPYTSRLANSERYIVCKGFKGINTLYLYELIQILDIWNIFDEKNKINKEIEKEDRYNFRRSEEYKNITIKSIINIDNTDRTIYLLYTDFKKQINKINMDFQNIQIDNINKTIDIIKYPPISKWYKENCKNQIKIAIQWCKKYNVPHKSFIYNLNNIIFSSTLIKF